MLTPTASFIQSSGYTGSTPSSPGHLKPPPLPARNRHSMTNLPTIPYSSVLGDFSDDELTETLREKENSKTINSDNDEENEDTPPPLPPCPMRTARVRRRIPSLRKCWTRRTIPCGSFTMLSGTSKPREE